MTEVSVYVKRRVDEPIKLNGLSVNGATFQDVSSDPPMESIQEGTVPLSGDPLGTWSITNELGTLLKDELEDIIIVVKYKINS